MSQASASAVQVHTKEKPAHWWSNVGWTVVGLAFVAGSSGAIFNRYYTGKVDSETRQKYTALATFVSILVVRVAHTIWTQYRSSSNSKSAKQAPTAADNRGEEGAAAAARRRRPRRDT